MYKRILVPVAGGRASTLGLQEAVRFAKDQKAHLRIIHVVDEAVLAQYPEGMETTGQLLETMIKDGKKTLNDAMAVARRQGIKAECVLHEKLLGSLADLILKEAKKWRADIIVMGTQPQSGIEHFFLGSDAETIARSTLLPVLLIHAPPSAKRKPAARRKPASA